MSTARRLFAPPLTPFDISLAATHCRPLPFLRKHGQARHWEVAAVAGEPVQGGVGDAAIGHVTLQVVPLDRRFSVMALADLGWSADWLTAAVADWETGRLVDDLEGQLAAWVPNALVVTAIEVDPAWRTAGFALPLLLGAVYLLADMARFAIYQIAPAPPARSGGPPLAMVDDQQQMLPAPFRELLRRDDVDTWQGAHLINLHDPDFAASAENTVNRWITRSLDDLGNGDIDRD